jgi:hypothetical protein
MQCMRGLRAHSFLSVCEPCRGSSRAGCFMAGRLAAVACSVNMFKSQKRAVWSSDSRAHYFVCFTHLTESFPSPIWCASGGHVRRRAMNLPSSFARLSGHTAGHTLARGLLSPLATREGVVSVDGESSFDDVVVSGRCCCGVRARGAGLGSTVFAPMLLSGCAAPLLPAGGAPARPRRGKPLSLTRNFLPLTSACLFAARALKTPRVRVCASHVLVGMWYGIAGVAVPVVLGRCVAHR